MALFVASAFVGNAGAQTDVTNTYLMNADFASTDGWTPYVSGQYRDYGNGLIGTYKAKNHASTTDETHLNTEYCLGLECRWNTNYASYQQTTILELSSGAYTLSYDVENTNPNTKSATYDNLFYVKIGETTIKDDATEWMKSNTGWTSHSISFTITEPSKVMVSLGYGTGSNNFGDADTPELYVSHLKLSYYDPIIKAQLDWQEAKGSGENALASEEYANIVGTEKAALQSEIAKSEPTTYDEYLEATAALQNATKAFTDAKENYDALVAERIAGATYNTTDWAYATSEKYESLQNALAATEPTSSADAASKASDIVTAYRQFVESNGIAEGVANAVDYTNKLKGTDAAVSTEGWNIGTNQGQSYTDGDGKTTAKYFDGGWASNAGVNLNLNQNVTLPSGKYLLQITARGAASLDTYTMSVGESTVDLPKDGAAGGTFGNGWSDRYLVFESEGTELAISITAKSTATQQWISFNRIRLTQLEVYEELATEEEYKSLNEAIAAAEENTLGFEDGEYAPYNNIAALQALAKAKSVNQEVQNVKSEIEAVTSELTSAVWTANEGEVNAIYDGNFAIQEAHETSGGLVLKGWDNTNDGMRQLIKDTEKYPGLEDASEKAAIFTWNGSYSYGKADGYTIPLKANTIYELSFKHAGWNGANANGFNVSVLNASGEGLATTDMGKATNGINTAGSLVEARIRFKTTAAGDYVLTMAPKANVTFTDVELYTAKTVDFEFKVDWGTLILPFAAEKPEGMEVYTCETENNGTLELVAVDKIEANTPYIVKKAGETTKFTFTGEKISFEEATHTSGMLTGTFESTKAPVGSYVLQKQNEVLGFYKVAEGKQPTVGAYRCYINASESAAPMFSLERGEGTTSIEEAELTNENVVIYDLAGRRVEKMEKGIYIVNGKKVIR